MRSDNLQIACVQPPTSLQIRSIIGTFPAGQFGRHLATGGKYHRLVRQDREERPTGLYLPLQLSDS